MLNDPYTWQAMLNYIEGVVTLGEVRHAIQRQRSYEAIANTMSYEEHLAFESRVKVTLRTLDDAYEEIMKHTGRIN